MRTVIGVDIGTQSTKALLCDESGRILAQASRPYQPDTPRALWAEQDAAVWLDATVAAVGDLVRRAAADVPGFRPEDVQGLCVSSLYGGSGIPVDAEMRPLHPCLIWMDRRAEAEARAVRDAIEPAALASVTGNHSDSYYGFTKMLWLRDNRPDVWAQTRYLLPPNAFVIHALTGVLAVDHSSAGNIGGVYDIKRRGWSAAMLDRLGIPRRMMPERLVGSSEVVGGLTADAAGRLGLPAGTPVVAGGVDAAVATFAAGATGPGRHVAMIGTSMCWGFITPDTGGHGGLVAMPHVFGGAENTYVFGGAGTAGASVTWFLDEIGSGVAGDADPHATLEAGARAVPAGADGLVFLPYLMGERSPVWDGRASGAFIGLTLHHTRAHLYRAVLEGIAFALRHNMEDAGTAALDAALTVVGGAARSPLWLQVIADVTGRTVLAIAEEVEAALGAAMLAAVGTGLIDEAAARKGWATLVPAAQPDPGRKAVYDATFAVYRALYPALKDGMHALRAAGDAAAAPHAERAA